MCSSNSESVRLDTDVPLAVLDFPDDYRLAAAPMDLPTVLVVDDNDLNLRAMEAVLAPLPCRIVLARSGMDALRHVLTEDFACILLDVQMPEMDGFETARLIHTRDLSRHIPIMFVTAIHKSDAHVERGDSLGAVDYLFKPVLPETMRAKVRVFLEMYERRRKNEQQLQDQQLQRELEYARAIQSRILPQELDIDGLQVFARVQPARVVGGDFYDLVRSSQRDPLFIGMAGDVVGRWHARLP